MQIDSVAALASGTRSELENWPTAAVLGCLVSPSRYLPPWNPLAHSPLARHKLHLRVRGGYEIECRADEFAPFLEIFVTGAYERAGVCWSDVRTIVDVGANVGMATLWFARRAPIASIVAVEPATAAYRQLAANVARNELSDRVTTLKAAVAAKAGTGRLERAGPSVNGRLVSSGGEEVRLVKLQDLLDLVPGGRVDLLKLDCEGAEYEILTTASESELRAIGCVLGEYHEVEGRRPEELARALEPAGFTTSLTPDQGGIGIFQALRT
jgi:FkbM family methyltransferase